MNLEILFKIHTNVLYIFMISVIFSKMGKHSDFHLKILRVYTVWGGGGMLSEN